MISTNPEYAPYDLPLAEIREVWKFIHFISSEVPEVTTTEQLFRQIESVKKEVEEMKKKL